MDKYSWLFNKIVELEQLKSDTMRGRIEWKSRYSRCLYKLLCKVKWRIMKYKNPIIETKLDNNTIKMQLAHELPIYKACFESYDRPIGIIARWIYQQRGKMNFVDVGANIGDTVVHIGLKEGNYLEIEGDINYSSLLKENLRGYQYKLIKCFLTDDCSGNAVNLSYGGPHILEKAETPMRTLSEVLSTESFHADLVKTDTDGFDIKVIRGGLEYFKVYHPFVFIEWYPEWIYKLSSEKPMEVFHLMYGAGYTKCIFFDNYGTITGVYSTEDETNFKICHDYTLNKEKQIYYYDICFVPENEDIGDLIRQLINWRETVKRYLSS